MEFLDIFNVYMPLFVGDTESIEIVAYELCETEARNGVIYFEVRYSPHLFTNVPNRLYENPFSELGTVTPDDVVNAVSRGLQRGERDFAIQTRQILSCIRSFPELSAEIPDLCARHRQDGVVAIDLLGCIEGLDENDPDLVKKIASIEPEVVTVYKRAKELGIHRTAHVGEAGWAEDIRTAIEKLDVERIGHGYKVFDDPALYRLAAFERLLHFETCPTSSYLTGSVTCPYKEHPIAIFARDEISFSINTDDPVLFGTCMSNEIAFCRNKIGLSAKQIARAQISAAEAAFLEDDEKALLLARVKASYEDV